MLSICRLCANCKDGIELTTQITELQSKLTVCCGWYPTENEIQLPTKACDNCVDELDKCWYFAQSVRNAEQKLNKLLMEQNEPSVANATESDELIADDKVKIDPGILAVELTEFDNFCDDSNDDDGGIGDAIGESLLFDDPAIDSDTECSTSNKIKIGVPDVDPFLDHLINEDRIADGTVSGSGVAKLEKLFPEMRTVSWTNCLYKCEKCNQTIQGPHNFFAHNRSVHFDIVQSMEFACYYCQSKHKREYTLSLHMAQEHFRHLKFRCWYCTDYFWDTTALIKHRNMHTNIEYKCELCQQIFMSRVLLYSHVSQAHQKRRSTVSDTKFTCDICSKDFATKWSIKSHMLQHNKKFNYVCDQCGWKFLTKGNLKGHLQTTHSDEKPFACKQCDGRFKTKQQLSNHSKRHEEFKKLACKICDKRFRQTHDLTVHMRSHNNIFPYTCKYCERKFRHTSSLKTHERIHTSEKPYACTECNYRSTNWPNLNKHSMRIHSIDLRMKKT